MSPLAAYFAANPDRKRIALARFAGITPSFVTQLCNKGKPGRALAVRIAEWTNGAVRPEHWDGPTAPTAGHPPDQAGAAA